MRKLSLVLLVFLVGCSSAGDSVVNVADDTKNEEAGDIEYFDGEYNLFDPLASRGEGEICIMITSASQDKLPAEFLTADDAEFPAICLNESAKDELGLRDTIDNLGDCKYSEVGNFYTITNLRIDPSFEYEKRADLVSTQRFMLGSTSCE